MGQFSYVCCVCKQEILHGNVHGYQKFTNMTVLWPNGDRVSGDYDGYGNVRGMDIRDENSVKFAHTCCLKAGLSFETLPPGGAHASDQGWWPGERLALERYGPPNMEEIRTESEYVCYSCHRAWKAKWSGGVCPYGCARPETFKSYQELVEPFGYASGLDEDTDGLGICREPQQCRPDGTYGNCYRFGDIQQIRVKRPDYHNGEWTPRCPTCRSGEFLEIIPVLRSGLQQLAKVLEE